jgi:hypothetical protein
MVPIVCKQQVHPDVNPHLMYISCNLYYIRQHEAGGVVGGTITHAPQQKQQQQQQQQEQLPRPPRATQQLH